MVFVNSIEMLSEKDQKILDLEARVMKLLIIQRLSFSLEGGEEDLVEDLADCKMTVISLQTDKNNLAQYLRDLYDHDHRIQFENLQLKEQLKALQKSKESSEEISSREPKTLALMAKITGYKRRIKDLEKALGEANSRNNALLAAEGDSKTSVGLLSEQLENLKGQLETAHYDNLIYENALARRIEAVRNDPMVSCVDQAEQTDPCRNHTKKVLRKSLAVSKKLKRLLILEYDRDQERSKAIVEMKRNALIEKEALEKEVQSLKASAESFNTLKARNDYCESELSMYKREFASLLEYKKELEEGAKVAKTKIQDLLCDQRTLDSALETADLEIVKLTSERMILKEECANLRW